MHRLGSIQSGIRTFRRVVVGVVGGTVVLIGLALLVLPGPAFVVLPVGLAILGIEFAWARRWLARVREQVRSFTASASSSGDPPESEPPSRTSAAPAETGAHEPDSAR